MVLKNKNSKVLFLSLLVFLTLAATGVANAQNSASTKWNGLKLPKVYQTKLDDFLANNTVMKDNDAKNFTLNFIEKEMEADWSISKENQLLFIWHAIYKQVTGNDLYDGKDGDQKIAEDFSNKAVNIRIRACGQKYRSGIISYMNELSAEAQQRSAEAQQRSAEAKRDQINQALEKINQSLEILSSSIEKYEQNITEWASGQEARTNLQKFKQDKEKIVNRTNEIKYKLKDYKQLSDSDWNDLFNSVKKLQSDVIEQRTLVAQQRSVEAQQRSAEAIKGTMKADSLGLEEMAKYYNLCIKNPSTNDQDEIENVKKAAKDIIENCKKYSINYRAILLKEVGDAKKVDAILKFYGVE